MLTNGSGEYIFHDRKINRYVQVRSMQLGSKWESEKKCRNVQHGLPKKLRSFYMIRKESPNLNGLQNYIMDKDKHENPAPQPQNAPRTTHKENPVSNSKPEMSVRQVNFESDIGDKIESLMSIAQELLNRRNELNEKLSDVEKAVVDAQHYIELRQLNAYEGYKAFKMFQDILLRRRRIKDEMLIVDTLVILKNQVESLGDRHYTPRILQELDYNKKPVARRSKK